MEQQLKDRIQSNWGKIKDELIGSSRILRDRTLERNIINFDEYEKLQSLTDSEQVDMMLRLVIKRKKCEELYDIISGLGHASLCEENNGSGSSLITKPMINTAIPTETAGTDATLDRIAKLEALADQTAIHKQESDTKFEEIDGKYKHLQEIYEFSKKKIDDLTIRLQAMNVEKTKLEGDLKIAQSTINELKERDSPKKDEIIQSQQLQIDTLEDESAQKDEQIKKLDKEAKEHNEELEKIRREFRNLNQYIEEMKMKETRKKPKKTNGKGHRSIKTPQKGRTPRR